MTARTRAGDCSSSRVEYGPHGRAESVSRSTPAVQDSPKGKQRFGDDHPTALRRRLRHTAQPRAVAGRPHAARARARGRPERASARAGQVLRDRLVDPRRVLHGARRGPPGPGAVGALGALAGRPHAAAGARRDQAQRPRPDGGAVGALARQALSRARRRRASSSAASRTRPRRSAPSSSRCSRVRSSRC